MDKQTYIENIPSIELGGQVYTTADNTLITSLDAEVTFDPAVDYIEYFIYNGDKVVIDSVETLDTYAIYGTDLSINPEKDLESRAYTNGKYYTVYNFLRPLLSSSIDETYYISQISTDRTEIRLASTTILPADTFNSGTALKASIDASLLYKDFSLNFGSNELIIANNILVDNTDPENTTLLVKLYEPLPSQFDLQTECWAVEKVAESTAYLLNIQTTFAQEEETVQIKGPNFNIIKASETNKAVDYQSSDSLFNAPSSSYTNQLQSILAEKGVELNIEYSDYSNFVFFSSAQTRLENFYYKLTLLESYAVSASYGQASIAYYNSGSSNFWNNKIQETITNFDGYEYYLYYDSGSTAWPKSNSTPPYVNVPSTSSIGQTWINNQLTVASLYDENNKDNLAATIPLYIREDEDNANYELFVEMVGQHFDSIWTYTKAVTEKYNSDNRVESGLSKDLVGTALKDFGIKLYQNNFTSDNLYNTYLGITPSGSLLPNIGQEVINTYVTASATGSLIPLDNLSSEVYKRIYHNLPFLLKKKGTVAGLRNLITAFGIPDTIFRINEYGGKDKNTNTWDQWQNTYNNALHTLGTSFVSSSFVLNSSWGALSDQPQAIEFRFKTPGIPASSHYSQSLWSNDNGAALILKYTGSANISGSYTGSIVDPYNQYGTLIYYPDSASPAVTASIYLPYFNQGWWSVLINKTSTIDFTVYAKNNNYQARDGNTIGFQASSSVSLANNWATSTLSYFGSSSLSAKVFSGSLQEIRYYVNALSESVFNDYVMNPNSIEGNNLNSSANELAFRAALGSELYTSSISIHPKVSGQAPTSSFVGTSNFFVGVTGIYRPNTEYFFYDQPVAGIKNAVSDKIKVVNTDLYETTLSAFGTLQQNYAISQSYTPNVNYLEVGFSPQNEINEDINSQIGYFNIGDYIGDPRQMSSDTFKYPDLEAISLEYFKKYTASYNYTDYLRLIKFFDNSLFKLIKDFTPARTAATTGGIIKQHVLERNRQRPAQVSYSQPEYTASVTSVARDYQTGSIGVFTGGTGGSVDNWVSIPQSWSSSLNTKAGIVNQINSSEYEFYNGEYSGSSVTAQLIYQLNTTPLLNNVSESRKSNLYQDEDYGSDAYRPTNYSLILSGSANKAEVQDSNYTLGSAWYKARYSGTKLTSATYNTYTPGDTSYSKEAVIDNYTDWFAYYDWIGGANPQYPGGANFHLTTLVNASTGEIRTLDTGNNNIHIVENIFKQNQTPTQIVTTFSSTETTTNLVIETGGALYTTIFYNTQSSPQELFYEVTYRDISGVENGSSTSLVLETSQSRNFIKDTNGGLFAFITSSSNEGPGATGSIETLEFLSPGNGYLLNKRTGIFVTSSAYSDTLLPLQYGDFIRFASSSAYLDQTFSGQYSSSLLRVSEIEVGGNSTTSPTTSSFIHLNGELPTYLGSIIFNNFRIFRRVPNETFVVTKQFPANIGAGLLIPFNFNPNYDPVVVAKAAGLIT
tara:strand:- start:3291 stop:7736 length:4446 start_codon:yes stop_codon:yes gene_type:complete